MRKVLFVLVALSLASVSASAAPVQWTLTGVTFTDGGTASGSFVYDANLNTFSAVNITTTAGSVVLTGATLQYVAASGLTPTAGQVLTVAATPADLTGTRAFALFFGSNLTNAGGVVTMSGQEANCINAACTGPAGPSRSVNAGTVRGLLVASAVPALSPLALAATALLLAGGAFLLLRRIL